jgi:hypothetical protein
MVGGGAEVSQSRFKRSVPCRRWNVWLTADTGRFVTWSRLLDQESNFFIYSIELIWRRLTMRTR